MRLQQMAEFQFPCNRESRESVGDITYKGESIDQTLMERVAGELDVGRQGEFFGNA
jgi:hypothetical protein